MEVSAGNSPRIKLARAKSEGSEGTHRQNLDVESSVHGGFGQSQGGQYHYMNALEILRETVRILRYNMSSFLLIAALLICPVSAITLSNALVDQSMLKRLTIRLMLVAKSSGLPLRPFVKHSCQKFSEMAISSAMCFPLFVTLSLLSKAAVIYSVDCTYSKKRADSSMFFVIAAKIWRRIVVTYLWTCMVIVGCLTLFVVLLVAICSVLSIIRVSENLIVYAAFLEGLVFSVAFANAIIICNIAIVICVLEDVSGPQALFRSSAVIKGQTHVGLLIFLGSTIGMAFVQGLFEHRVKVLSYGDGTSRIWEGPLLVIMYSFLVLIDSMMSAVFYFSCRSHSMEASCVDRQPILESMAISAESMGI